MPEQPNTDQNWFTRERILVVVLAFATLLGIYVCYLIAKPFIAPMAFALALAVATQRPFRWLLGRIRNNTAAAAMAVVLVTLVIVAPAAALGTYLVQQAVDNLNQLRSDSGGSSWRSAVEQQPQLAALLQWLESRMNLEEQLRNLGGSAASHAGAALRGSIHLLTQLVIMLFVLFFLYRDRKQALLSIRKLVPLAPDEADQLFHRIASTIIATVNGSLIVAMVQSTLAGLMYFILGVPAAALWAAVTFIAALIPMFGTVLVWGPVTIYLIITGHLVKALILVCWGAIAIGTIDNFLYPYLVGDRLRLHTVVTFFSLIGGIALFGPAGLILGPLALAVTIALMDVWWQRTSGGQSAEEAMAEAPESPVSPGATLRKRPS